MNVFKCDLLTFCCLPEALDFGNESFWFRFFSFLCPLLVALLRGSGIPAGFRIGTLSTADKDRYIQAALGERAARDASGTPSTLAELRANPERHAEGVVLEARLEKGRGAVATILVQQGTLRPKEPLVLGTVAGRVRALTDHKGKKLKMAGPSTPVEIIGLKDVPAAGRVLLFVIPIGLLQLAVGASVGPARAAPSSGSSSSR